MRKITSLLAILLWLAPAAAAAQDAPQKAIALNNGNVTQYGARMRVTKTAWDFALLTVRDNFKKWSAPGGAGANLLLDPGYDVINHGSAGMVRTTPMLWDYIRYDSGIGRSNANQNCGSCICGGCNASRTCGQWCSKSTQAPNPRWLQVRRSGSNLAYATPAIPTTIRPYFREYGFYVADPTVIDGNGQPQSFKQMQFCTQSYSNDAGSGSSGACTTPRITFEICVLLCTNIYFYYNVRLFFFPNMRTEYMGINGTYPHDPAQAWDPWNPPVYRGCYTGLTGTTVLATVTSVSNCSNGGWCSTSGSCCCTWCACVCSRHVANCNTANGYMAQYVYGYSMAGHTPTAGYNARDGSYKRPGDDQALYTNIGQMQIHSYDRNTFLGVESSVNRRGCQLERYYAGNLVGGKPNLPLTSTKIANCLYPMSWWDGSQWKACDPYDTWNADGTLNPLNDDEKWIYPGNPANGSNAYGSTSVRRCGRQPVCTGTSCWVHSIKGTYCNGEGDGGCGGLRAKTTNFKDTLRPGGGWYFLEITNLQMLSGTVGSATDMPRMEIDLRIPNVRVEAGVALDAKITGSLIPDQDIRNVRALGQIKFNAITAKAVVKIYSLDVTSCLTTGGATCTAPFLTNNNGTLDPDYVYFDIDIPPASFTITAPSPWYVGECDNVFIDVIWGVGFNLSACDIINDDVTILGISFSLGIKDMLIDTIKNALNDEIKAALSDFVASVPRLNSVLGDPINLMGTSLIETGIYAAGNSARVNMPDGTARWPINMQPGPTADQIITDFRLSLGFKPIAFRPPTGTYKVMDVDNFDPPLNDSVYGVPKLLNPDTMGCGANCSLGSHLPTEDADQQFDAEDYITGAAGGIYRNPKTLANVSLGRYQRIPEFYQGPLGQFSQPPAWCSTLPGKNSPATIRGGGGTAANFASIYPMTTWLSFSPTLDPAPSGSGMVTPGAANTFGNWDTMKPNTVLRQNYNDGSKETVAVPYDFSLHIHQRTIAQFLQTAVASGATCIEFAAQDTQGADTPFKPFLNTSVFQALLPGITSKFPDRYMKVRISSVGTPRARTGIGTLTYTPDFSNFGVPAGEAPLPIGPTKYMLSAAFPDTRIEFLVEDPASGTDISLLKMYWTPVVGMHAQGVRRCYYLDPLRNSPECTSNFVNVRTVSGYYEIYVDMNAPLLMKDWENARDFPAGYFSNDIGTSRFFSTDPASAKSNIVIESTYCGAGCDELGVSQLLPMLMDTYLNLFFVSRISFMDLTVDFLYAGVDGPNDDNVPAGAPGAGNGGDYIGIYARFLGSLDLFSLLGNLDGLLAPRGGLEPAAFVPGSSKTRWFNTNRPAFPVETVKQFQSGSDIAYTYALNGGLWRTPRNDKTLEIGPLWEGEHKLSLRAIEHTRDGAVSSLKPADVTFRVDTVPPEVDIKPSPQVVYNKAVVVGVNDAQTPEDQLETKYQWNDGEWLPFEGSSISVRKLKPGMHTLRVRSTDLAGNVGEAVRKVTVGDPSWWQDLFGCRSNGAPDASWLLVLLVVMLPALRRFAARL